MKVCPKCQAQLDDNAVFCPTCGTNLVSETAMPANVMAVDPWDHTAEFSPEDISNNKVIAMVVYLLGFIGIIIALLASKDSPYVAFHVRQGLKIAVVTILTGLATAVLCWTCIVPIAGAIFMVVLLVVEIICFFSVCNGKAVEPVIIRSLGFLK